LVELASKIEIQLALTEETIAELSPSCENKNCIDYCTFHAIGLYDNNNRYIVQKVYICSDLTISFMVPLSDKKVTCIEANNTISSFSPVDALQVNFQEGESCLLQHASVDVPELCSNRFEKALLPNINNDAKPRMVCSQEGEKGIEC
jgi:hypothetical protein